jgi:hypothetical protein
MGCLISLPFYQVSQLHDDTNDNNYDSDLYYQDFENEHIFDLFILND